MPRLFWPFHFVNAPNTRGQLQSAEEGVTLDDLLNLNADVEKLLSNKANLPKQLARIDIENSLPKLSTLPATGGEDDVFSSRNSIDAIFHPHSSTNVHARANDDLVDVLLARARECSLHIRIFDSFEIGTVNAAHALPKGLQPRRIVQHAGHPLLSKHFLVLEAEADGPSTHSSKQAKSMTSLHLIELGLRFISQTSDNLPLLASKATQMQNLLRYIVQIQTQVSQEVRTAFDLPSRFIANIDEMLREQDSSSSFTTAAYQLVLTGECNATLKEWLVDQVGERGLKRWEKAVGDCLDLIRRMLSECLLPAIERSQVVISRLDGLARFVDTAEKLGLEAREIKAVREVLDVLTILCEDMLRDVSVETREFGAFIRWIKWEAEVEALEDTSERAEEMRETYGGESELRMVLDYISGAMRQSRLQAYIEIGKDDGAQGASGWGKEPQLYERYKEASRSKSQLLKLGELVKVLQSRCEVSFGKVAESLRKQVLGSYLGLLAEGSEVMIKDSELVTEDGSEGPSYLFVLAQDAGGKKVAIHQRRLDAVRQEKAVWDPIELPDKAEVLDLKFSNHEHGILALVQTGSDRQLLWRDLRSDGAEWEIRYQFDGGMMSAGMKPSKLAVNGRKGRSTVTVTDEPGLGFVVLSLDG
jgi:anaphase-promoting complex subunit 4